MASTTTSIRLTDDDKARLDSLKESTHLPTSEVFRFGLIALRTLVDEGYEFRSLGERPTVFKRSPQGRTITFFDVSKSGGLIDQGRMAQWSNAPDDE